MISIKAIQVRLKKESTMAVLATIVLYLTLLAFAGGIGTREWYVDENIFIPTVKLFYDHPTVATLKTYPEIPGPLSFIMYAAWAKAVGFSTFKLRLFSMLLAGTVFYLIFSIVRQEAESTIKGYLAMLLSMANPYMAGLSVFVFTDMAMLFFMLLAYRAFSRSSPVPLFFYMAGALLCRQYAGILYGALLLFTGLRWWKKRQKRDIPLFFAILPSLLPLAGLFVLWGGIAPQAGFRKYVGNFKPKFGNYLVFYIATWWVYLLPVIIWKAKTLYGGRRPWIAGFAAAALYPLFPVTVSEWTKADSCCTTNGYLHRMIRTATGGGTAEHMIFALLFFFGCRLLLQMGIESLRAVRDGRIRRPLLNDLLFAAFLLLMPLQYQVWEKYLVMVLPFVMFRFFRKAAVQ